MKNSRASIIEKTNSSNKNQQVIEVLYQKMGDRWFAFSLIDNEVFVGSICQEELEREVDPKSKRVKVTGNS